MGAAVRVGCAGWSLPAAAQPHFGAGESHLARYATRFDAVEINSSFHRSHRQEQYARWAAAVPPHFRFAVKLPKVATHERRLRDCDGVLEPFALQVTGLGQRLGPWLVQMPPSLAYDPALAQAFFRSVRRLHSGLVAVEPRHPSWFCGEADALLKDVHAARVLADPVRFDAARSPGGWNALVYLRLHGSPRTYYSPYAPELLEQLARRLDAAATQATHLWCIFDNTASGAAATDALELTRHLGSAGESVPPSGCEAS